MAGKTQTKSKLNKTLYYIVQLLQEYSITNWFIAYGTLLGIVRNHSCIHGDDDIDIICDTNDMDKIKKLATEHGFSMNDGKHFFNPTALFFKQKKNKNNATSFLKLEKPGYAPIDFYCATIQNNDYHDTWEEVIWKNVSVDGKFIKKKWKDIYLQLPHQYISKLRKRYGKTWRIPNKGYKGTRKLSKL